MKCRSLSLTTVVCAVGLFLASCGPDPPKVDTGTSGVDTDANDVDSGPTDAGLGGDSSDSVSDDGEEDADTGSKIDYNDQDKDGVLDFFDNCPSTSNPNQKDDDGDGVGNDCDNRPNCANDEQKTKFCDKDSYNYERDSDGDGTDDVTDNCPDTKNPKQKDSDGDGTGDACETPASDKVGPGNDSDGDGLSDQKEAQKGTSSAQSDSDGDGVVDGVEVIVGTDPNSSDSACAKKEYTANLVRKPVDIIFAIDTSGSMGQEISGVQRNINNNFQSKIQNSGVNYRVIMLADKDHVCIQPPLGTGNCGDGASTDTPRFKHIDQAHDGGLVSEQNWQNILSYYNGTRSGDDGNSGRPYKQYLRKNAFKILVAISDEGEQVFNASSNPKQAAQTFDQKITNLSSTQFGTQNNRNYRFHAIVGVPPKGSNNQQAWQPSDPVQNSGCSGNGNRANANPEDEHAAIMTGGLRYPVCETPSYNAVFKALANSVVKASRIGCKLDIPSKSGSTIDNDKIALQWKSQNASQPDAILKVHDKSNCGPNRFWIDNNGKIRLCDSGSNSICQRVSQTKKGTLKVFAGCENCTSTEEKCDYKDNDCDDQIDEECTGCTPELCNGKDDNCNGTIDEGCCTKKAQGDSCSKDSECCSGWCKDATGVCGKPCRPSGVSCVSDSQCCSGTCGAAGSGSLGTCVSK